MNAANTHTKEDAMNESRYMLVHSTKASVTTVYFFTDYDEMMSEFRELQENDNTNAVYANFVMHQSEMI